MRVLMLAQFYPPIIGGEERHVVSLSEAMVARGHQVAVATMPHPKREMFEIINGVEVHSLSGSMQRLSALFKESERPHAPPFPDPELTARLAGIIKRFKPDVIHGHNWLLHSFLPLKAFNDIGFVSSLHDYSLICAKKTLRRGHDHCDGPTLSKCMPCAKEHFGSLKGVVTASTHFVSNKVHRLAADHFIAVSQAVAEESGIVGGKVPFSVLPTFIPDELSSLDIDKDERLQSLPTEPFLLFVGELSAYKGVYVLLEAYQKLKNAPPLVLIGRRGDDTPDALPGNVTMFESWPHAAVMHAWNRCLFGIAPSSWVEPCGTVAMEANVMGKPVIASNHGGLAELVEDGINGVHVTPNDSDALAAAMQSLIDDRNLCRLLGDRAFAYVERFKAKSIVPQIESIYRRVIENRKPRHVAETAKVLRVEADKQPDMYS